MKKHVREHGTVKNPTHGKLSFIFLFVLFFSNPTVKFWLKPQIFQQLTVDLAELQGCSTWLNLEHKEGRDDTCAGDCDDTAVMIFRDESIVALVARPIITSANEFPGGKSKTSRVEMSWECAVQWKIGWRLPGRLSSMLKSTFMLMNKQSASSFFTLDLLLTAPKTHH